MSSDAKKMDKTPYSNTGSLRTNDNGLRACVDWLSVTFKTIENPWDIVSILGLDKSLFKEYTYGNKFYHKKIAFGDISILYDGFANNADGCHLTITGQGCREYEQTFKGGKDWSLLFALLLNWDVHFSRLDIAIDDFVGYFTIKKLITKIKKGHVKSLFRKARSLEEYFLKDGSTTGETLYFGKSDIIFRFYNKYLQMIGKGYKIDDDVDFWNRYEIQMRDDQAHTAGVLIAYQHTDVGKFAKGIFSRYLNFLKENKTDSNKRRWPIDKFWLKFLDNAEKISLSQVAPDATVEKAKMWVDRQVAPTLAMIYKANDYDDKIINEILKEGLERLEDKHEDMILRYKINTKAKKDALDKLRQLKKADLLKPRRIQKEKTNQINDSL